MLDTERRRTSSTNQQQQNDSWFWEQETSSAASKDGSSPAEMADLTTIPLDANDHEVIDKLRQQIAEKESKVKSLNAENAILNEKLKHLNDENQQLNKSIEELDIQHQVAIEKVLDVKNSLQENFTIASEENEKFKKQIESYRNALDAKDAEKLLLKENNEQLLEIARKCEQQIEELSSLNLKYESEIAEFKNAPEEITLVSNDECLKKINDLINSNFKQNSEYIDEEHFMTQLAKWMSTISTKQREMDFENSKLIDENKHIKEEASKLGQERDALKAELINYEIECTELLKNNSMLMADIENLRTSGVGKLETILEGDDDDDDNEEVDSNTPVLITKPIDENFPEIKSKLENELQSLKNQLTENVARCKIYQQEIENLENEKCNYLFELNELKSEEERNILQKELKAYKAREMELLNRLDEVESERDNLQKASIVSTSESKTLEEKENELVKALNEMERLNVMTEQLNELENVKSEMSQRLRENEENIQQLIAEKDSLVLKCEELRKNNEIYLESHQKSNEQVQELQKKLLETSGDDMKKLEHELWVLSMERNELQSCYETALSDLEKSSKNVEEMKNNFGKLSEELNSKILIIENLKQEKEELEKSNKQQNSTIDELKLQISTLDETISQLINDKEKITENYNSTSIELQKSNDQLEELRQKILSSTADDEINSKIFTLEESLALIDKEKEELLKSYNANLENLQKVNQQLQELQDTPNIDEMSAKISSLEEELQSLTNEKDGLIALVTTKHNENVQYHNEILRLNQLLQADEAKKFENEEQFNDQIKFLREKCDLLAQNLIQEQNNYRLLQQEKNDVAESNSTLNKDIERLRQHLLEVADAYTFEQVSLQKQVEEYKDKLMAVESDAKQSANAYTSASIRANQQAETLQSQFNLLVQQRDDLLNKLSQAEDRDNKNQAALTNLQIALEIFQRGEFKIYF